MASLIPIQTDNGIKVFVCICAAGTVHIFEDDRATKFIPRDKWTDDMREASMRWHKGKG